MARRILIAMTAAAFFAVGLLMAQEPGTAAQNLTTDRRALAHEAPPLFVEGTIESIGDEEIVILTTDNQRRAFVITTGMDRTHFEVGNRVRLDYDKDGQRLLARSVVPAGYETARRDYPNTATQLPVLALVGVLSLLTGSALWLRRNRVA